MDYNKKIAKSVFEEFMKDSVESKHPGKFEDIFEGLWSKTKNLGEGLDVFCLLVLGDYLPEVSYEEFQTAIAEIPHLTREDLELPPDCNEREAILYLLASGEYFEGRQKYVTYALKALNFCIPF